ncbi:uncharacterized protein LOC117172842 [Belonocnema kinseyi]|uniref:uncharacterized protein LOC117172842 n=1 Tax=Belonocnema kinseyi TaxID=2817044 RepID=UPI00143CDAFE|nr:uncharacterized protein LOC117172842 [Belonocnema kinseyi]XP_033216984.1 uncharacterized protein LOC117172842 [Belonocnema kinseyi]
MRQNEEGPELFRGAVLYREWGCRLTTIKKLTEAVGSFEKSIALSEGTNLRTLLGLTRALMMSTRYREAAENANKCLELDPQNYQVIWMRVETLFKTAEFELSLIDAHRGKRIRPYPFTWGIYQGNQTIKDCVGKNTSPTALRQLYPWIKEMQDFIQDLKAKNDEIKDEFEGIDEEKTKFKVNDPEAMMAAYLKKLYRFMAEYYLQSLSKDKQFLEDLLERPGIWSANKKHSAELERLAKLCLHQSTERQEILRARRPLYFFRFRNQKRSHGHKMMMLKEEEIVKNNILIHADFLLKKLYALKKKKDYAMFFRFSEHVKDTFKYHSNKMFPMKQKCLLAVYNLVAWAYLESRDLSSIKEEERKKVYLKHHIGIHVAKLPRDSDIGWIPTLKKKQALQDFRRKLAMTNDPVELTWIFHDFSKLLMETHQFEWARYYAKRAREKSTGTMNQAWLINANHILLRIELHQNNRNDAKEAALLALSGARKLKIDYLIDFYEGIVKILDEIDVEKMSIIDNISQRQQLIIDLMPMELKAEMAYLFRSMDVVPAKRRLSVMPGCKPIDKKLEFTCKKNTILVSPPIDAEKEARKAFLQKYAPPKKILGYIDFREYE